MGWSADQPSVATLPGGPGSDGGAGLSRHRVDFRAKGLFAVLGIVLLSGLMLAVLLIYQREHDLDEGRRLTEAFVTIVDEQTARTFQVLDQRLESIARRLGPLDRPDVTAPDLLAAQMRDLPSVKAVFVLDALGRQRYTTAAAAATLAHEGEDYFRIHRTRPGSGFVLGTPRRDRDATQWVLHASRPILDSTGRFAGVVVAVLQAGYFDAAWRALALESGSAISLMRTDGTMLLRSPLDDAVMGHNYARSALFTQLLPVGASGSLHLASSVDGTVRLAAYRTLAQHPDLLVVVGRTTDAVLAGWRQMALLAAGGWLLGSIALVGASARRRAERELSESREQFETLAQQSLQGIALIREGQLSYLNPALCTMAGRSAAEITRLPLAQLMQWVHPDDQAQSTERQQRALRGEPDPGPSELRILHGSGQWRWIQSATRTITLRGESALLAMVVDIHDRKLTEVALRASEERFRDTFESSAIGISLSNQEGRWIMVNPALCRIVGYTEQELLKRDFNTISHPDDMPLDRMLTAELYAGARTSFQMEKRYLHRDGHAVWINLTVALVRDAQGLPVHTVAHIEDISGRKQLEQDLIDNRQQLRVLSARVLAAQETERRRIAHELHDELGQALTAIKINLQAENPLQHGTISAPMADNLRIVDEVLGKVRGLALALRPSMLDDLGLVPALRWLTGQTGNRNGIAVQLQAPSQLGRLAPDLETAVFRIVQEALTNIVRHALARHAWVHIERPTPDTLLVLVRDDGVGFDVAAMRQRATEGNSMGLLGMQERAALIGADLTIESATGSGCTVTLRCPIHPVSAAGPVTHTGRATA